MFLPSFSIFLMFIYSIPFTYQSIPKPPIPPILPLMKTTSFLYYFSENIISIDKIPPILQAFKVVISCPTTEHGGIWVGPLLTSSKDMAQKTQATFDWVLSAVKTFGVFVLHILSKMDKTSK